MSFIPLVKFTTQIVVSVGVGKIMGNIIRATTPATVTVAEKVFIAIGGVAISGITGTIIADYIGHQMDLVVAIRNVVSELKAAQEDIQEVSEKTNPVTE